MYGIAVPSRMRLNSKSVFVAQRFEKSHVPLREMEARVVAIDKVTAFGQSAVSVGVLVGIQA